MASFWRETRYVKPFQDRLTTQAHATLPHQGQGTGQAVEDAVTLAILLKGATKANVSARLAAYQRLRKERADRVVTTSTAMGKVRTGFIIVADQAADELVHCGYDHAARRSGDGYSVRMDLAPPRR